VCLLCFCFCICFILLLRGPVFLTSLPPYPIWLNNFDQIPLVLFLNSLIYSWEMSMEEDLTRVFMVMMLGLIVAMVGGFTSLCSWTISWIFSNSSFFFPNSCYNWVIIWVNLSSCQLSN
jgi:hypothetical protein